MELPRELERVLHFEMDTPISELRLMPLPDNDNLKEVDNEERSPSSASR